MHEVFVCLDVGGTFTKGIIFNNAQEPLLEGIHYFETNSKGYKDEVIASLVSVINELITLTHLDDVLVRSIALAFPGPFDYERGVSWITGLNKFESLYGLNVKDLLINSLKKDKNFDYSKAQIFMHNDATSFAFGENNQSKAERGAYFTIGTGFGSTFIEKGKQVFNEKGIPENGMVYNLPFNGSILDDYLSARGLNLISEKHYDETLSGFDLYKFAEANDEKALTIFKHFGQEIGRGLNPVLKFFKPEEVVFGGQISNSLKYFEEGIRENLDAELDSITIRKSIDTSLMTLRGLFILERIGKNEKTK